MPKIHLISKLNLEFMCYKFKYIGKYSIKYLNFTFDINSMKHLSCCQTMDQMFVSNDWPELLENYAMIRLLCIFSQLYLDKIGISPKSSDFFARHDLLGKLANFEDVRQRNNSHWHNCI